MHDRLRQNGEKINDKQVKNLWFFTGIIDIGTTKVYTPDWNTKDQRSCKVEFQFPHIERHWWDWTIGHHISTKTIKISLYKANKKWYNDAELRTLMKALWAKNIPRKRYESLQFARDYFNKPVVIISEQYEGSNGKLYDRIAWYKESEKKKYDLTPHWGNSFFDMFHYNDDDFTDLQPFHKREIVKTKEYLKIHASEVEAKEPDLDKLPF